MAENEKTKILEAEVNKKSAIIRVLSFRQNEGMKEVQGLQSLQQEELPVQKKLLSFCLQLSFPLHS